MSRQRHIPVITEPVRPMYEPSSFFHARPFGMDHRMMYEPSSYNSRSVHSDPGFFNVSDSFRDMALTPYTHPVREPMPLMRDPFRDAIREHTGYHPGQVALPLSRSFYNPERQLASMDTEMQRMASEMKKMFDNMQHLMPVDANPESWRLKENFLLDNPVSHDPSGGRNFHLQFDVRQFKPEEIDVKTSGNQLTVHARHEEKHDGKTVHREYHRQYTLPKEMNVDSLVSKLSRDGVLTIEAPLPVTDGHKEKLIPIKHN